MSVSAAHNGHRVTGTCGKQCYSPIVLPPFRERYRMCTDLLSSALALVTFAVAASARVLPRNPVFDFQIPPNL